VVQISQNNLQQASKLSFINLPITVGYSLKYHRFKSTLFGGISPGLLIAKGGKMLDKEQFGVSPVSQQDIFNTFSLNGLVGLDLQYRLSAKTTLMLCNSIQYSLINLYKTELGVWENPFGYGVQVGVKFEMR
jgi:hypothetical protein